MKNKIEPLPIRDGLFFCDGHLDYLKIDKRSDNLRFCKDCWGIVAKAEGYEGTKDYWDGQAYIIGEKAFVLTPDLGTVRTDKANLEKSKKG